MRRGVLVVVGALVLSAGAFRQTRAMQVLTLASDGQSVYDAVHDVTWLADANLPASNRFGLPLCDGSGSDPCVNASGSMNYVSAVAWVRAMNAAHYLGRADWQLPT